MPASRSSSIFAVVIGTLVGSSTALLGTERHRAQPKPPASSLPFRPLGEIAAEAKRNAEARAEQKAARDANQDAGSAQPPPATSDGGTEKLVPRVKLDFELVDSPHDRPVKTGDELLRSLRDCDSKVPDECERAADAYEAGRVTAENPKDATRFRKVALTLYVRQCEAQEPSACYELARKFAAGVEMQKDPERARSLMVRVRYLCRFRSAEICEKLAARDL